MIISPQEFNYLPLEGVVGLTSGCFDLLHFYHLHYLERCRAECDFLIVGVDSDQLLTAFKQKASCIPEHHRAAMVSALKCVDAVFIMRNLSQFEEIGKAADKIFKNSTQLYGKEVIGADKLVIIPDVAELQSTTEIVNKIRQSEIHGDRIILPSVFDEEPPF